MTSSDVNIIFEEEPVEITLNEDPVEIEMPAGQNGQSIHPRGAWSSSESYGYLDLVSYQGSSYVATKTVPTGTLPTDTGFWILSAEKGLDGASEWGDITGDIANQTDLAQALAGKANVGDSYSKAETDALLADKADADDVYTKDGVDEALDLKADADSVYTKTETDALLDEKADADDVYTKTETDEMLYTKASAIENTVLGNQTITDGADGIPAKEIKIVLNPIQEGSGTPTPNNIRPVTPYTKLNFAIFGKNWLPAAPAGTWTQNGVTVTSDGKGTYTLTGKSTAVTDIFLDIEEITLPPDGYTHLLNTGGTQSNIGFGYYFDDTAVGAALTFTSQNRIIALGENRTGMKINKLWFRFNYNNLSVGTKVLSPMVLETDTVTPFIPYGKIISVDWEDEAGTVYSGIYDVMTGILTVDYARVMLADLTWTQNAVTEHAFDSNIPDRLVYTGTNPAAYSNIYKLFTGQSLKNYTYGFAWGIDTIVYVKDDRADTPADMVQLFQNEGTYIVYKLASPVTYQFDPALFKTVYGENHIWADTGDVEVTYRADTKLFITEQIAESETMTRKMIADSATADGKAPKSLAIGDLIIVGDELRKATANIGQGSAITASNSTTATLADVIKALQ